MDFNKLVSSETADCVIKHPVTGEPTDIVITVYGMDSAKFRKLSLEAQKAALKAKAASKDVEDTTEKDCERLAELTAAWKGLEDGGKEVRFSKAAAMDVYMRAPEIRRQVDRFIFQVANFLPKA